MSDAAQTIRTLAADRERLGLNSERMKPEQPQRYLVMREHVGDQPYRPGEVRTALPSQVAHLVPKVLIVRIDDLPEDKAQGAQD